MNFFPYMIDNIRDKIITMQPSTRVSHRPSTRHKFTDGHYIIFFRGARSEINLIP